MENLEQIITIASAGLGMLVTILGFLIPLVKSSRAKKKLIALNKLSTVLQSLIIDAEKFTNFTGKEKKEYVVTKANSYAIKNKIAFDETAVSEKIEKMVALSKQVNTKSSQISGTSNVEIDVDRYKIG